VVLLMSKLIIVPAFNEEANIGEVLSGLLTTFSRDEVVVVDDGSSDGTKPVALSHGVGVVSHVCNLGKGVALKSGIDFAISEGVDFVIFVDADGQNCIEDVKLCVDHFNSFDKDVVFTFRAGKRSMPFVKRVGNKFLSTFIWMCGGLKLRDSQSGLKAVRVNFLKKMSWDFEDYEIESGFILECARLKASFAQIPIRTIYKDVKKGTNLLSGVLIARYIFNRMFRKVG